MVQSNWPKAAGHCSEPDRLE